jgi:hypothetical protein
MTETPMMTRPLLIGILLFGTLCSACGSSERPAARDSMSFDSHMVNSMAQEPEAPAMEEAGEDEFVDTD